MQDRDLDAVNSQRRRRKRIARMKSMIVLTIAGWILLSMVLIIALFVKVVKLERKLDDIIISTSIESTSGLAANELEAMEGSTELVISANEGEEVIPLAGGMDDATNLASEDDVHKVYLTFEDGPTENTAAILDILKEYDVKATFFVVGKEDEESLALYQRIVEEGHTLGMHSYSNQLGVLYQSAESFENDYIRLQKLLFDTTGEESEFYRFPGGSGNTLSEVSMGKCIQFLNEQGIVYFDWNVSSGDATNAYSSDEIVANVMKDVVKYKTSVVLLHDDIQNEVTVEALRPLLDELVAMDAEILPIDKDTSVIQQVRLENAE